MGTPAVSNGRRGLSDEELRRRYPVLDILAGPPGTGQEAWETVFEARPDIMVRILQDVMLRGDVPATADVIGLGALVVVYGGLAIALLRRQLRTA